ncbi:hypothetical protein G5B35_14905 [Parapusillimonas sp. SGNA-6]|nr:hypothetical protein [Parapusillimonas sp. SGNA-6]
MTVEKLKRDLESICAQIERMVERPELSPQLPLLQQQAAWLEAIIAKSQEESKSK